MVNRLLSDTARKLVAPTVFLVFAVLGLPVTPSRADDRTDGGQTILVRGMVTLPDGSPANGGVINFGGRAQFGPVRDGKFEFSVENIPPGDYFIGYSKHQCGFLVARVVPVAPGQREAVVSLRTGEQRAVKGIVSTEDLPRGVPNAQVRVQGATPRLDWVLNAGSDGSFLLDGLDLRGCTMQAVVPYHRDSKAIEIEPPFPMQADLRAPDDTVIVGQVMDLAMRVPVPGAVVAFGTRGHYGSTTADDRGFFEFTGLQAGPYRLEAYARFFSREEAILDLQEGRPALGIVMSMLPQDKAHAYGWVLGPRSRVAGAKVSFRQWVHPPLPPGKLGEGGYGGSGPGVPQITYSTLSQEDGRYALDLPVPSEPGQRSDPWWVKVEADGYLTGRYTGPIEDPEHPGPYVFRVFRGGRLSGSVSLPGGIPPGEHLVAGISIPCGALGQEERHASASYGPEAPVDPQTGRFDFGLIQPGVHQLSIRGHPELTTTVTVKEGEAVDVKVPTPPEVNRERRAGAGREQYDETTGVAH
jgi:hypothetical protein